MLIAGSLRIAPTLAGPEINDKLQHCQRVKVSCPPARSSSEENGQSKYSADDSFLSRVHSPDLSARNVMGVSRATSASSYESFEQRRSKDDSMVGADG